MSSAGIALCCAVDGSALPPFCLDGAGAAAPRPLHCSPESILVFLADPGSQWSVPMWVLESDSIATVKLRIQTASGFAVRSQKLVFRGRELARNNCHVRDYGIEDGGVLHLVVRLSDLCAITVRTSCGKSFEFSIERGRNVAYVKRRVAEKGKGSLNLDGKELVCEGEELDDRKLVGELCKEGGDAVIHLFVRKAKALDRDFKLSIVVPDANERAESDDLGVDEDGLPGRDVLVEPMWVSPEVELPLFIDELIRATVAGIKKGNPPVMSSEGTGGAYFMPDEFGQEFVGVFKPIDEEPLAENNPRGLPTSTNGEGLKRGTRVGEGALREVAAYILDHPLSGCKSYTSDGIGFSGVRPTVLVRCVDRGFGHRKGHEGSVQGFKIGSLQKFEKNIGSCEEMGPQAFPVGEVHKISVLDMRLANADRHAGNILVHIEGEDGRIVLVPIDHGYCLPENFEDCTFEWLYWPQAREPFGSEALGYIESLDAERDLALLEFYGLEPSAESARTLRVSTMLLKKGAKRGLTPYGIGSVMCRETVTKESEIEEIVREATDTVLPGSTEAAFLEAVSAAMDRRLDELAP